MGLPENVKQRLQQANLLSEKFKKLVDEEPARSEDPELWNLWMKAYNELEKEKNLAWAKLGKYVVTGSCED